MKKPVVIAVVGATGAVGREVFRVLEERQARVSEVRAFASDRSEGKGISALGQSVACRKLAPGAFRGVDIAYFDASDAVSRQWVPVAASEGAWVVDNSAAFRMETDIPLCVPEVNGARIVERAERALQPNTAGADTWRSRVFAGPNCSTVQLTLPLKVLRDRLGLRRVVVSTYQSTSGAGTAAMEELKVQTAGVLQGNASLRSEAFAHRIAFNCIPHIGGFGADGFTSEENKLMAETRKILELPSLRITATAIRVPTLRGHAESVHVELEKDFDLDRVREWMRAETGIVLQDEPGRMIYPMNETFASQSGFPGAAERDEVFVGRLRRDPHDPRALLFWVVSDNLRKGAATNAVQIGDMILGAAPERG